MLEQAENERPFRKRNPMSIWADKSLRRKLDGALAACAPDSGLDPQDAISTVEDFLLHYKKLSGEVQNDS